MTPFTPLDAIDAITASYSTLTAARTLRGLPRLEDEDLTPGQWAMRVRALMAHPSDVTSWETAGAYCVAVWIARARAEHLDPTTGGDTE